MRKKKNQFLSGMGPWVLGVLAAAALVLINDLFFFESIVVTSSSMEPTFLPNERVFLQRTLAGPIRRFDVVVINSSVLHRRIVKRVIGLPGECVILKDGWIVYLDSTMSSYMDSPLGKDFKVEQIDSKEHLIQLRANPKIQYDTLYGNEPYCLANDEYFALGDNRLASGDSRYYGPFKRSEIQGKLRYIWYSYDKIAGRLRTERMFKQVQ